MTGSIVQFKAVDIDDSFGGRSHLLPAGSIHAHTAVHGSCGEPEGRAFAVFLGQFPSERPS